MRVGVLSKVPKLFDQVQQKCSQRASIAALIEDGRLVLNNYKDDSSLASLDLNEIMLADPKLIADRIDNCLPRLQWMQATYAGVNVIVDTTQRTNYVLTRIGSGFGPQMANYCFSWILHFQQEVRTSLEQQKNKDWNQEQYFKRVDLEGKRVAILGAGAIGSAVAHTAAAFGMKCLGLRSSGSIVKSNSDQDYLSSIAPFERMTSSIEEALSYGDYIINCLPSTPSTRCLLTSGLLKDAYESRVKSATDTDNTPSAPMLINIGRGDFTSADTILAALEKGHISLAVLDVCEEEPLCPNSPLWTHPRVVITPHISAISTANLTSDIFVDNLERFISAAFPITDIPVPTHELANKLKYSVNRDKGY